MPKLKWGDEPLPNEDVISENLPSKGDPKQMTMDHDLTTNTDSNSEDSESSDSEHEESITIETVASKTTMERVDDLMVLDDLDLNRDEDNTDALLRELYPEYRPVFSLASLGMELIFEFGQCLDTVDLVMLLIANKTISRHPVVHLWLLQLMREKRVLKWAMGQWCFWRTWQYPRETARNIPHHEEKLHRAVRHFQRFNEDVLIEKMRIADCAHVWGVLGMELREELEWLQQVTNSDYDDIMQQ